jgi:hypothetical protein
MQDSDQQRYTMPKEGKDKVASAKLRHAPLDNQIQATKKKAEGKFSRADPRKLAADKNDEDDIDLKGDFLDAKTSKKIMRQAQEQREELMSMAISNTMKGSNSKKNKGAGGGGFKVPGIGADLLTRGASDDDSEDDDEEEAPGGFDDDDEDGDGGEEYDDEYEVGSDGYMDIADMESGMTEAEKSLMGSFFGGAAEVKHSLSTFSFFFFFHSLFNLPSILNLTHPYILILNTYISNNANKIYVYKNSEEPSMI